MEREILSVLEDHDQLSVVEIADIMGAHPVTVDRHCYKLHQAGYVHASSGGIYTLTDDGAASLAQQRSVHRR